MTDLRASKPGSRDSHGLAPLIAIVGSDGSGKSTVGDALLSWLRESRNVELCHLGKQSGNIGRAIKQWPIVGGGLDRRITATADKARDERGPGLVAASVIALFTIRRSLRFRRMMAIRRKGIAVLADRFPQIEVPGPMDGPGLSRAIDNRGLVGALARRERRAFERMIQYRPTLVIRLNVDIETAFARKPDHRYGSLMTKIEDVRRLTFGGAPIADIDSTQPLNVVLDEAKRAVTAALADVQA